MSAFQELKIAVRKHTLLEFNFCREKLYLYSIYLSFFLLQTFPNCHYTRFFAAADPTESGELKNIL